MSARLSELSLAKIIKSSAKSSDDHNLDKPVILLKFIPPYSEIEYLDGIWIGGSTGGWVVTGQNLVRTLENGEVVRSLFTLVEPGNLDYIGDSTRQRCVAR